MLKDSYRRKNDKIRVRESLLDDIRAEQINRTRAEREKQSRRRQWWIAIPTAAAAVAACVALVIGLRPGKDRSMAANMNVEANTEPGAYAAEAKDAEYEPELLAAAGSSIEAVASYEELSEIMRERSNRTVYGGDLAANGRVTDEAVAMPEEAPTVAAEPTVQVDGFKGTETAGDDGGHVFSGTNNQVADVDEADIVKTDGTWIYTLSREQNKLYILAADGKDTKITASVKLKTPKDSDTFWQEYTDMMLYGDRLYILGTYYDWSKDWNSGDQLYTFVKVYDLGDRTNPKELTTLKQQGSYRTARLIDGMLLIVSDFRTYTYWANGVVADECIPKVAVSDVSEPLVPGDIYVNPDSQENGFVIVTTINAADGTEYDSHKAVLGGCDTVYCSGTDLYIASQEWSSDKSDEQTDASGKHFVKIVSGTDTNLFRFSIDGGKIEPIASTKIRGALLNQFSMDAYNGSFRLVVTRNSSEETIWTDGIDTYEWKNDSDCALYVLDGELNVVGRIEELAKDERVQSVRFMGDTAYFVTFRQTDPLFAADLSDPHNPKVLSALKIPGFSAYLHPFGEGKLLGIGYDAEEEHGWTENVKLSMFDISDPANVTEAFKLSVKDASYTNVQYNHKVVFVDVATGTVAFQADDRYLVFRVDGNGFKEVGRISLSDEDKWFSDARGLYIDDVFYVVSDQAVVMLSFETMEKLGSIKLK